MSKLRQILEFIMSLLGFLLNLKKKNPDGEEKEKGGEVEPLLPEKQEVFPAIVQPALPRLVPDGAGVAGVVGGPFGGRAGVFGRPVDTLGVRGHGDRWKQKQQLPVVAGWGLLMYAAVSCFC